MFRKNLINHLTLSVAFIIAFSAIIHNNASAATYEASISTSGSINLNVSASGNGANVVTDTVTVRSTCPKGYTLSISGPTDSTLYKDGNRANNNKTIRPTTGTIESPKPIIGDDGNGTSYLNTWGYSTTSNTATGTFVGLTNTPTNLLTTNSSSQSGGDSISIYYGASVDITTEPGQYKLAESAQGAGDNVITYHLLTSLDCTSYLVNFNPNPPANTTASGSMANQRINEDEETELSPNAFTVTGYTFIGWNTAQDGGGTTYSDKHKVTNLVSVGETITLYAMWEPPFIRYDGNGNTSTFGMGKQSVAGETLTTLWASNYARDGYGFAGWSETQLNPDDANFYTNLDSEVAAGKVYGPNQDVTTSEISGKTLYAVWIPVAKDSNGNELTFQTTDLLNTTLLGGDTLSNKANGYVTALRDVRDNDVYAVAKLADGNYWMIENLRLGGSSAINLTTTDTNITADVTLPVSSSSFVKYNDTMIQMNATNTLSPVGNMTIPNNAQIYSYGNYYSWSAAKGSATALNSGSATTSICPKGWSLPLGNDTTTSGSFSALDRAMGGTGAIQSSTAGTTQSAKWRAFPNNYLYSGYIYGSSFNYDRGSIGHVWSSTVSSSWYVYYLNLDASNLYPGMANNPKYSGLTVRCLVDS